MRIVMLIMAALMALIAATLRVVGMTGFRQVLNDARGLPAQTRYQRSRQR